MARMRLAKMSMGINGVCQKRYPSSWVLTAMQSIHIRMNLSLSPPLKNSWICLWIPQTENQQGSNFNKLCRIHRCICKESRKNGKRKWWERWRRAEKERPIIESVKQDPFMILMSTMF